MYFYDIILNKVKNNLKENYLISFEIGDKEGNIIEKLANKYLPNSFVLVEKDYNNFERYVFISSLNLSKK